MSNNSSEFPVSLSNTTDAVEILQKQNTLDYTHHNRVQTFYGYACTVIYPTGVILNILCVIIVVKIGFHKTAVGMHLLWIAVVDLFTILTAIAYSYPLQGLLGIPNNNIGVT